jgi:hypothetical protein
MLRTKASVIGVTAAVDAKTLAVMNPQVPHHGPQRFESQVGYRALAGHGASASQFAKAAASEELQN